jgi:hypothetical protein
LIPGGVEDLLWWAQAGADSWVLDDVVGVLLELRSMCEQEEQMGAAAAAAAGGGLVLEVIRKVGNCCPRLIPFFFREVNIIKMSHAAVSAVIGSQRQ